MKRSSSFPALIFFLGLAAGGAAALALARAYQNASIVVGVVALGAALGGGLGWYYGREPSSIGFPVSATVAGQP